MMPNAYKEFTVEEFSMENMHYRIEVFFKGVRIEIFEAATQLAAWRQFEFAGYKRGTPSGR